MWQSCPLLTYYLGTRWFTRPGWKRTKEDIILELKSAYAIAKLRKSGYSKQKFYKEAVDLYKEINTQMAIGDKGLLRKSVTENMYSIGVDRNDLNKVFVQLTLEFLSKQLNMLILLYDLLVQSLFDFCCECYVHTDNCAFLTALHRLVSKFEAYDSSGAVVAGDKSKECRPVNLQALNTQTTNRES
ncbi:UNVERIFIED_CONTAM: hypothetical protein Sradi_4762100 [Sesamum radiatum]|uniref:Uncharacterized protein n=1 Tax=Sesamum radiatum TaxID=300843 RepID=A0AAW2MYC1_SESRA